MTESAEALSWRIRRSRKGSEALEGVGYGEVGDVEGHQAPAEGAMVVHVVGWSRL